MRMIPIIATVGLSMASLLASAQNDKIYLSNTDLLKSIKVYQNGQELPMAWSGGLNNPQFAMADLNKDGKTDMVIFEHDKGIKTFLNTGTPGNPNYIYAPDYETTFPAVSGYLILKDYNCDNIPDLFNQGGTGVWVAKGFYDNANKLAFHPTSEIKHIDPEGWPLIPQNVYVGPIDIPAIEDVDNDGDLDIVAYYQLGAVVKLYRNMRVEENLHCDSFKVRKKDNCWGKFWQPSKRTHVLEYSCDNSKLKTANKTTDGANALCLFDSDGDGDMDYLDGNTAYSDLQFMRNGKVEYNYFTDTMTSQDTLWQGMDTSFMQGYPMAFWLDIDNDNDKDIVVSPRGLGRENKNCVGFYENTGSNANPTFTHKSNDYLVDKMIDLGGRSYPVLYDYNKDGKLDLLIGSAGYYQKNTTVFKSRITYLQNTSSGTSTSFELVTDNLLSYDTMNVAGSALAIGDLDNDGLDDLVVGKVDGTMMFYKNMASNANQTPVWVPVTQVIRDGSNGMIDVGNYAAPLIYDINNDKKKDLIVGCEAGFLVYYMNQDPSQSGYNLKYETNKLGGIKLEPDQNKFGHSAPFIGKIDNTNHEYLMVGSRGSKSGWIYRFDGFQNGNTTTPYTLVDSIYSNIQPKGLFSSVAIGNINNDTAYEMFVGNELGGINVYKQMFEVNVKEVETEREKMLLYPNPAKSQLTISIASQLVPATAELRIYNSMGQSVEVGNKSFNGGNITIDVRSLPTGLYMCSLRFDGKTYSNLFLKNN